MKSPRRCWACEGGERLANDEWRQSGIADRTRVLAGTTTRVVANDQRAQITRQFRETELTASRVATLVGGDPHGDHAVAEARSDFIQLLAADRRGITHALTDCGKKLDLRLGVGNHLVSPFSNKNQALSAYDAPLD